jgi:hypothetical protein
MAPGESLDGSISGSGGIFVSYRRHETRDFAGRLADRLADRFGEGRVFIDVNTIEPGVDFAEEISRAVDACAVLVAIIGPEWLTAADAQGRRRLDDPNDLVRLEIEAALARDVRVIPILAGDAIMPSRADLPESLAGLARRNALRIHHESFHSDAGRLISAIEHVLPDGDVPAAGAADARSAEPVRTDPARAARLLSDAEQIASTISDEPTRAWAMSEVGAALAAADPHRAEQLFTEVERIAKENTDAKVEMFDALRGIVGGLAATDPDRAERFAETLTDYYAARPIALRAVVKALAATDPDRAERIARSIDEDADDERSAALGDVAVALAATDLDRALRLVEFDFDYYQVSELSRVAAALAATDPGRAAQLFADAERIARSETDIGFQGEGLFRVAEALAGIDPERAERIAESIIGNGRTAAHYDEAWKGWARGSVATALAVTDPGRAERIARSINFEPAKVATLRGVAEAMAPADPERAELLARSIPNVETQESALSGVARAMAVSDPDRAERLARSLIDERSKVSALCGVATALA